MNSEDKFWISFWTLVATVVVIAILSIAYTVNQSNIRAKQLLDAGMSMEDVVCTQKHTTDCVRIIEAKRRATNDN